MRNIYVSEKVITIWQKNVFFIKKKHSFPNFEPIVRGYGFDYHNISELQDLQEWMFMEAGPAIIDVKLDPNTLICPKAEMGHPINDQYPYVTDEAFDKANRFVSYQRITHQNDIA